MHNFLTRERLCKALPNYSDKTLKQIESRLDSRIAALQKCVPWPALIASIAADLEAVWAEQRRRSKDQSRDKR